MSTTGQDFLVIGENIHATRVLLQKASGSPPTRRGRRRSSSSTRTAPPATCAFPKKRSTRSPTRRGALSTSASPCSSPWRGAEPDSSTALSYLSTLAQRQVKAGAHFLDVNVDEISTKLDDQLEAMRWLVRESGAARSISRCRSIRPISRSSARAHGGFRGGRRPRRAADAQLGVARAHRGARAGGTTQGGRRGYGRRRVGNADEH